ncbi:uncharacterized protein LOC143019357 [Oratosquilla oratoria]|uniref:uncharacterized protein LOC143019357 n=1 Tax=Oratosquilla oratoria TaxID=337810 RepID=UPI003F760FF7
MEHINYNHTEIKNLEGYIDSTDEFIDILRVNKPNGFLASMDAVSLFSNLPVLRTINVILNYVYEQADIPTPTISKHIMEDMLIICTTEAPFKCPEGKLCVQHDGISMGSTLGVLFAQAFLSAVEEAVFLDDGIKPQLYYRYSDDILVCTQSNVLLENLRLRPQ